MSKQEERGTTSQISHADPIFSTFKNILFKLPHIKTNHCLLSDHRKPLAQAKFAAIPDYWDKTQIPQTGYKVMRIHQAFKLHGDPLFQHLGPGLEFMSLYMLLKISSFFPLKFK